ITFVTGVLSREPVPTASAAAMANGAVESFVVSAAPELPRGIRINAVSPNVLANSPHFHDAFAGMIPVTDEEVASASVRSIEGNRSEEHTSELQSRFDLVCRLLPEKQN